MNESYEPFETMNYSHILNPTRPGEGGQFGPPNAIVFAITQKVFKLGSSIFFHAPQIRLKGGFLYLLPKSSGILPFYLYQT